MSNLKTELTRMDIGECIICGDMEVMRVPHGWLWTQHFDNNATTAFTPDMGGPMTVKKQSLIQVAP